MNDKAPRFRAFKCEAKLLGTAVPTSTKVWSAIEPLECINCEGRIRWGDLFTRALASGYGRAHQPYCGACRPFQILSVESKTQGPERSMYVGGYQPQ